MDDPAIVGRGEPLADLAENGDEPPLIHGRGVDLAVEADAREELHEEHQATVGELAEVEDLDDVRRADFAGGPGLFAEAGGLLRILAGLAAEDLEGDASLDVLVLGLVDDTHAALAEPADQAVAGAGDRASGDQADAGGVRVDPRQLVESRSRGALRTSLADSGARQRGICGHQETDVVAGLDPRRAGTLTAVGREPRGVAGGRGGGGLDELTA